ncbi:CBS domain-containing protein [Streptomyces sp. NPDC054833]
MTDAPHVVSDVMTLPVVAVGRDARFKEIVRVMEQRQVSAVPVVEGEGRVVGFVKRLPVVDDEDRLSGIVSRGDLLKVFLRSDEGIEEEVRRTVVSYLFPTVGHGIHVSVRDGVVTLRGRVHDTSLIWVAERLVRALEGVVGVEARLSGQEAALAGPEPCSD